MWEMRKTPVDYWVRHPFTAFAKDDGEIQLTYFKTKAAALVAHGFKRMKKREAGCYERVANGYNYLLSKY